MWTELAILDDLRESDPAFAGHRVEEVGAAVLLVDRRVAELTDRLVGGPPDRWRGCDVAALVVAFGLEHDRRRRSPPPAPMATHVDRGEEDPLRAVAHVRVEDLKRVPPKPQGGVAHLRREQHRPLLEPAESVARAEDDSRHHERVPQSVSAEDPEVLRAEDLGQDYVRQAGGRERHT